MSRFMDFWPLVMDGGKLRRATFGEAKAYARRQRAMVVQLRRLGVLAVPLRRRARRSA